MKRPVWIASVACLAVLALSAVQAATREDGRRVRAEMRRQMRVNADPGSLLQSVYANYVMVKRCHEARQGDLSPFVEPREWGRADAEAKALRARILAVAPSVPDDLAWQLAVRQVGPLSQNTQNCRGALAALDKLSEDLRGER